MGNLDHVACTANNLGDTGAVRLAVEVDKEEPFTRRVFFGVTEEEQRLLDLLDKAIQSKATARARWEFGEGIAEVLRDRV